MSTELQQGFRLGPWKVEPLQGALTGADGQVRHVEPKVMDIFVCLAEHANKLVGREYLLETVWSERTAADERLTGAISELRRALHDDRNELQYIETVPKRGYRLTGQIRSLTDTKPEKSAARRNMTWSITVGLIACLGVLIMLNEIGLLDRPLDGAESQPITSIAVLPFDNLTRDPGQEYFADGMTETLITELSKIGALQVISRQSVMRFKDTNDPLPEIAHKLNVDAVVEGSAMYLGGRVRISVKLIDAATDELLWAESYNRELTTSNIFAIQSEITTAITNELRTSMSPDEQDRLGTVPTQNMAALEAYYLGKQQLAKRTTRTLARANQYFQQAIDLDTEFALAYVGLADSYYLLKNYAGLPKFKSHAKARIAIDQALELDDQLGQAYATLGLLRADMFEYLAAERAFKRAMELAPNYATTYHWYGVMLHWHDRHEEALALYEKAAELDPFSPIINLSVAHKLLSMGRIDEALARYHEILAEDPDFAPAYHGIAYYHRLVSGQMDEAIKSAKKGIAIDPDQTENLAEIGADYLNLGDPDIAEYWLNRAITLGPEAFLPNLMMQAFHAFQGNDADALAYAGRSIIIDPRVTFAVRYARDIELRAGRYSEARALYEQSFPELLAESELDIDGENVRAAIDFAVVLIKTGEQDRADLLLSRSLQYLQSTPAETRDYSMVADVRIYALQGKTEEALSALREAVDKNWRFYWWYYLKLDPSLESIRDEPEFQAMLKEVEADMATQLARLKEYESNGTDLAEFEDTHQIRPN